MLRLKDDDVPEEIPIGRVMLFGIISLILLIIILSSIVMVPTGGVGIKMEFGKATATLDEGINFITPFVNSAELMDLRLQKYEAKANAASSDLQVVDTTITLNFQVDRGTSLDLYRKMRNEYTVRLIEPLVQEAVKANTAKYTADQLITNRDVVKNAIENQLRIKLIGYGIIVKEVSITNFEFSEHFDAAIEQKVVAEQNALKAQYELQQKTIEAQTQVVQANASAQASILRAEGEAQATLLKATAEAAAIQKINAAITPEYLKYYSVEQWDGRVPLIVGQQDGLIIEPSALIAKE